MWESPPRQTQTHAPWSPYAGGTFVGGAGPAAFAGAAHLSPVPSEHVPDHPWNQQSPPSTGAHGGRSGYRENFLSLLGARNVTPEMFEEDVPAACDYLTGVGAAAAAAASNMAGGAAGAYGLGSVDWCSAASVPPARREAASSPLVYTGDSVYVHGHGSFVPCYDDQELKGGSQQQQFGARASRAPTAAVLQQLMIPSRVEIQSALAYSGMGSERQLTVSSFDEGSLLDAGSFGDYRPAAKFLSSNNSRREQDIRPGMGGSGAASSVATTRRKSAERVGGSAKKSKQEASSHKVSSPKPQAPKVKLGEKITALQQMVSPFGKTDTSSVLLETIKYIEFLHEQLRLFSEPYMTRSAHKGHIRFESEEKTGHDDLRGRGLCLVPVSLSSQVYHDDTLPDCLAPAYSSSTGCLYP